MAQASSTAARRARSPSLVAIVIAGAAAVAFFGNQSPASSSSSSTMAAPLGDALTRSPAGVPIGAPVPRRPGRDHELGAEDGFEPDGASVFADETPAVANLDPALVGALRQAANAAGGDGIEIRIDSGWRSAAYQRRLLRDAVATYGSEAEAARWVATPEASAHVSGDAVDVGPSDAVTWLFEHGSAFGLCGVYGNEPWHFELRAEAVAHGCPPMYPDPAHDPRMER